MQCKNRARRQLLALQPTIARERTVTAPATGTWAPRASLRASVRHRDAPERNRRTGTPANTRAGRDAKRGKHSISPTFDLFVPLAFGFGVGIKWTTGAPESLTLFPSSLFSEGARPHLLGRTECQWKIVAVQLKEY
jgi:hypothetical protein